MNYHLSRLLFAGLLASSAAALAAPQSPTLARIAASQRIYLGYLEDGSPFTALPPGQKAPAGYTWDVCRRLAAAVEKKLGKPLAVVPVAVTENTRVMLIKTGVVDIDCGAAANTVARDKQADFSYTLYVSETRIMVRKDSGIAGFDQLAGKRVVVLDTGLAEREVQMRALQRGIALNYVVAESPRQAMAILKRGDADAYIAGDATLAVQRAGDPAFTLLPEALAAEPWALMLPEGDDGFRQLVDATLAELMQSGELARLYDKWFVEPAAPGRPGLGLPMSEPLKTMIQYPNDKASN